MKRVELAEQISSLQVRRQDLLKRLSKSHPEVKSVERRLYHWNDLLGQLPKAMESREDLLLANAVRMLQDFSAQQDRAKKQLSKEELVLRSQIEALIRAQRATLAKQAMVSLMAAKNAEKNAAELKKLQRLNVANDQVGRVLKVAQAQALRERDLLARKNSERVDMQNQLRLSELRLMSLQKNLLKKEKDFSKIKTSTSEASIVKKLSLLDQRLSKMEKLLQKVIDKLEDN